MKRTDAKARTTDSDRGRDSGKHPEVGRERHTAEFWTTLSTVAALIATLFAGWAAWETRRSAVETGKATRASVWLTLLTEYAEPNMLNSMKALRKWRDHDPAKFAEQFRILLLTSEESPEAKALDEDRRRVYSFFNKLRALAEGGIIDEEFVSATWSSGTYTYVKDVLMPMEQAKADALFEEKALTVEDKRVGEALQNQMIGFYRRVAERSQRAFPK